MKIEVVVLLMLACLVGALLTFLFGKKQKVRDNLSEDMKERQITQNPNDYVEYAGEHERQDTKEYIEIINKDIIDIFRHEGDMQ